MRSLDPFPNSLVCADVRSRSSTLRPAASEMRAPVAYRSSRKARSLRLTGSSPEQVSSRARASSSVIVLGSDDPNNRFKGYKQWLIERYGSEEEARKSDEWFVITQYQGFKSTAGSPETEASVISSCNVRMAPFTVGAVKEIPGVRKYVAVDGGMFDNPRYALYQAKYTPVLANRANEPATETVSIAGKCCESGDLICVDVQLPPAQSGDILAVLSTGAYNYSMASNYNRNPIPPVVLVRDGEADYIVKPQTYEDIVRNDVIPDRLR